MTFLLRIKLLGEMRLQRGQEPPAHFDTRQTAALLAYLAFYGSRVHFRETLAEQLWPEEDAETTRSRFRTALWALRRVLEPAGVTAGAVLVTDRATVGLAPGSYCTDVADFERAVTSARRRTDERERAEDLCRAIELYTGDLLPGSYEEWIAPERERLAESYRQALGQAAEALSLSGDSAKSIEYARRAVNADLLQESAHAALIALYARAGRAADARRQYQELERILHTELDARPSEATWQLLSLSNVPVVPTTPKASMPTPGPAMPGSPRPKLEPVGGGVPLASSFYIQRKTDTLFADAVTRQDSIVLVKGARQVGKTSLLARGLQQAREAGKRVVLTDFQSITAAQLQSSDALFVTLARQIADQLDLDVSVDDIWHPSWGWNVNFSRFLRREVLNKEAAPVVWGLDEVDRLFGHPYSADVFGLFRSWHNARSLDPSAPWAHLTLAMAYATEAHLFITDLNQSPFNVGTRLVLDDFTPDEIVELNRRYDAPLGSDAELQRFIAIAGGQPYLVQRGLHWMAENNLDIDALEETSQKDDGLFSDHLRRLRASLLPDHDLIDVIRTILDSGHCPANDAFFRLQSAGVLAGNSASQARMRCGLYHAYLDKNV